MKLHDLITLSSRESVSDGAGGQTPGELTELYELYANVKPMGGTLGLQYQQLTGTKGYEIWIRTDFDRKPDRGYIVTYQGIYGDLTLVIEDIDVGTRYTKLTCRDQNTL